MQPVTDPAGAALIGVSLQRESPRRLDSFRSVSTGLAGWIRLITQRSARSSQPEMISIARSMAHQSRDRRHPRLGPLRQLAFRPWCDHRRTRDAGKQSLTAILTYGSYPRFVLACDRWPRPGSSGMRKRIARTNGSMESRSRKRSQPSLTDAASLRRICRTAGPSRGTTVLAGSTVRS